MLGVIKHTMRILLVLLVFQFFIAPTFLSVVAQGSEPASEITSYHAHHSSVVIPPLLKEKEETEESTTDLLTFDVVAIIDFADHSSVLTEFHETRFAPSIQPERYDHRPPLFILYSTYII